MDCIFSLCYLLDIQKFTRGETRLYYMMTQRERYERTKLPRDPYCSIQAEN